MRALGCCLLVLATQVAHGQFPLVRSLEVRPPGQERPVITRIAQDARGLIWTTTETGLLRTDGEQVEVMALLEGDHALCLAASGNDVVVGTALGLLMRCGDGGCDTLSADAALRQAPMSSLLVGDDGTIWIGTYGRGLARWHGNSLSWTSTAHGLPDDHVNALALLPDGGVVLATDQGLALVRSGQVQATFSEANGAPDNLTLCVSIGADGLVWAGTDRSGVFGWQPAEPNGKAVLPVKDWTFGEVRCLAVSENLLWAGTKAHGPIAVDLRLVQGTYSQGKAAQREVLDLLTDSEGAVWWCEGSEYVHRADPAILFVPEHEGLDLRHITALCADADGSIWFATADGLYEHVAYFSEERKVSRVALDIDPQAPIVSLAVAGDGTIWGGTFGKGAIAVATDGRVRRFTAEDGLANDNVLAVRHGPKGMYFATLDGISLHDGRTFHDATAEAGFVFDVLATEKHLFLATDGNGVQVQPPMGSATERPDRRSFYTLVADAQGTIWAAGPGTGLCKAGAADPCFAQQASPFDGDLYGVGATNERLIAFGSTGVLAFDPRTGAYNDVAGAFGLEGITAELNVVARDRSGALWFGCSKGLVRLHPSEAHFSNRVPTSILGLGVNGGPVALTAELRTPHDRNTLSFRFTGPHFADPGAVRFQYRLVGLDDRPITTRDREVTFAALRPGRYTFQVRGFIGANAGDAAWTEVHLTVDPPWWQRTSFLLVATITGSTLIFLLLRARDRRIRYRDRLEKERVRFQLDALRSQVDPHFLFNSFNALVELIETAPERAVEHVEQLSIFFRNILQVREHERISVQEELGLVANYFALEQRRFGEAISLDVRVDEHARTRGIVPLTLQLLVENALKHNIVVAGTTFTVQVASIGDAIVVSNPLRPRSTPPRSTGFGLHSITTRYSALTSHPIEVDKAQGHFTVRIPLIDPTA